MELEENIFLKKYEELNQQEINILFLTACVAGQAEHVRYLLRSPHLKFHADIHTDNDLGFILATRNGLLEHSGSLVRKIIKETYIADPNYEKLLQYLIIEEELKKTAHISDFLEALPNKNHYLFQMINKLFLMIEMKNKLNKNLKFNSLYNSLGNKI